MGKMEPGFEKRYKLLLYFKNCRNIYFLFQNLNYNDIIFHRIQIAGHRFTINKYILLII